MKRYTVKAVARLAGVSVRTLHHYDELGLLKPAEVGANGYRYYGREELFRLQQILLHRELEFPLELIGELLDAPSFDRIENLKKQREVLAARQRRYRRLIRTLDETLADLQGTTHMEDKDLYQGFAPEKQSEYEDYIADRFTDGRELVDAGRKRIRGMTKADFAGVLAQLDAIEAGVAKALTDGLPASSEPVQSLMRQHCDWIAGAWGRTPAREGYIGLGRLYLEHPDFRARYETRAPDLTEYLAQAMRVYAEQRLS